MAAAAEGAAFRGVFGTVVGIGVGVVVLVAVAHSLGLA